MLQTTALPTHHADLVTDIAYDFYGERLATASADQRIKVWRKKDQQGQRVGAGGGWELEDEWKAHEAPILSISFSHPEFGSLLVSCSYDRSVRVWEETDQAGSQNLGSSAFAGASASGSGSGAGGLGGLNDIQNQINSNANSNNQQQSQSQSHTPPQQQQQQQRTQRWLERAHLTEARGSVRGVGWAPNAFGVKVASISTDSYLRVYTSLSPLLNDWQLTEAIYLPTLNLPTHNTTTAPNATATNNAPEVPPTGTASSYGSNTSASFGNVNPSIANGANSSKPGSNAGQGQQQQIGPQPQGPAYNPGKGNEALGGWALSWCKEKWWGLVIATTSGHAGVVKIINLSSPMPTALLILEPPATTSRLGPSTSTSTVGTTSTASIGPGSQAITSLSWGPNGGRSYHSIATGSRDGTVRVWKIFAPEADDEDQTWRAEVGGEWGKGDATVGKVEWNVTGSILSVSSEDGQIRLYKATFAGKWACMGSFSAEAPNADEPSADNRMQE